MKKLFLYFTLLAVAVLTQAAPVNREQAQQKAREFINSRHAKAKGKKMSLARQAPRLQAASEGDAYYYVFNVGEQDGFVVVSGDDRTPAILGYATDGTFSDADMPENMRAWMEGYERQLRYLEATGAKLAEVADHEQVEPLISTKWDQGRPYNNDCPTDPRTKTHSYTGCVATAMAQVLYYYKYPEKTTTTIPSYWYYDSNRNKKTMPALPPEVIDWDNMLDSYTNNNYTDEQAKAVSRLMLLCGQSVEMTYTAGGSGAGSQNLAPALKNYFGYASSARFLMRNYYRADKWDEIIYNEIAAGRPVLYGGSSVGGGHEFIVDGYSHDGLYHVNWGWSGGSDNYFLLSILNPDDTSGAGASSSADGYSFDQDAVVGITPNEGEVVWEPEVPVLSIGSIKVTSANPTTRSSNGSFKVSVSVTDHYSKADVEIDFKMGLGIYNEQGELLEGKKYHNYSLYAGWGFSAFDYNNVQLGAGLPDGNYLLKAISGENGKDEWVPCIGSDQHFISVNISGNTVTFAENVVDLDVTFDVEEEIEKGISTPVNTIIENNGDIFLETVFLAATSSELKVGDDVDDEDLVSGMRLELEPGEETALSFAYTPKDTGTKKLQLVTLESYWDDYYGWLQRVAHVLGTTTVTVKNVAGPPHLNYSIELADGIAGFVVKSDPTVLLHLTNDGKSTFAGNAYLQLYKYRKSGNYWYSDYVDEYEESTRLKVGESTTLEFTIEGLEDNSFYGLAFNYIVNNQWVTDYDNMFNFNTNFSLAEPDIVMGDANGDGKVDVSDVTATINYILGKASGDFVFKAADVNEDGIIDVSDVTRIINIILGK